MIKYALYQTVSVGLLFVSVRSKHRNSLFRYRSETTETNCLETNQNKPKQNGTSLNFLKKYKNILQIKLFRLVYCLFRLVFCLFRFNGNIETLCLGIEAKQPKQTVSKQTDKNRQTKKNEKTKKKKGKTLNLCDK